jgi:Lrp/AsnC family transcriptional regulator, leucine-responsive regulatory protein
MDEIDLKILVCLTQQGRMTWSELGQQLNLSSPAAADRVRRLEERGIIQGYSARLNADALGCDLLAFVAITLERPEHREPFWQLVLQLPEIQECHHVAGEDDYWLKVRCRGTKDLERLISNELKRLPGVLRTRTTIVLSTVKETAMVPFTSSAEDG